MKISDVRQKKPQELLDLRIELLKEQFSLRVQRASGQFTKTHLIKKVRRNLAKIESVLAEQKRGANYD